MGNKYKLQRAPYFKKKLKKLAKKDKSLLLKVASCLKILAKNPFYNSLKTHKVESVYFGKCQSSRVSADVRIIWDFNDEHIDIIDLYDIGGHSWKGKVYK